jgi:hypothetical protein
MTPATEVLEGEVVIETTRQRDRNAVRTPALLPPSKEAKLQALERLSPERQIEHVTEMLVHSNAGLLVAIAAQDLPAIANFKAQAATIAEIAKQLRLGKEMQTHAAEFCRRAERGLGVGIRDGQQCGEIETPLEAKSRAGRARHSASGNLPAAEKPRPTDFANADELSNSQGGIYDLTDGVSDEQFEEAIADAKSEGNLSRANVARKSKAKSRKESIDANDPLIDAEVEPAPKKVRKTAGARKVIEDLVVSINGLVFIVNDTNPAEVNYSQHVSDIEGVRQGMNTIRRFLNQVEQEN